MHSNYQPGDQPAAIEQLMRWKQAKSISSTGVTVRETSPMAKLIEQANRPAGFGGTTKRCPAALS